MSGTDYDAMVKDTDKIVTVVKPKAQVSSWHAIGAHRVRMKIRTGNGDDAHLWPSKPWADYAANETETKRMKQKKQYAARRMDRIKEQIEKDLQREKKRTTLSEIFGVPKALPEKPTGDR